MSHVCGKRHGVQRYLWVIVLAHECGRLQTDSAITQGSSFGTPCNYANVLSHVTLLLPTNRFSTARSKLRYLNHSKAQPALYSHPVLDRSQSDMAAENR